MHSISLQRYQTKCKRVYFSFINSSFLSAYHPVNFFYHITYFYSPKEMRKKVVRFPFFSGIFYVTNWNRYNRRFCLFAQADFEWCENCFEVVNEKRKKIRSKKREIQTREQKSQFKRKNCLDLNWNFRWYQCLKNGCVSLFSPQMNQALCLYCVYKLMPNTYTSLFFLFRFKRHKFMVSNGEHFCNAVPVNIAPHH